MKSRKVQNEGYQGEGTKKEKERRELKGKSGRKKES
jgi:hypothetical protein